MWRTFTALPLGLAILLAAAAARAQSTAPASTPSPTPIQAASTPSSSPPGAFAQLSPGGQKIALALCNAQVNGCPQPQAPTQSPSSTPHAPLTREQIAAMKQHRGWGVIFKQMQQNGQIPADVKNLGQLVSGRSQAQTGSSGITITTASGKSQVVGTAGSPVGRGPFKEDPALSSAGDPGAGHASANSHGGGHGK